MRKYRKKPLIIEAILWDGEKLEGRYPIEFFHGHMNKMDWHYGHFDGDKHELIIETLEGEMICSPGDFIIRGIKGEFYPCKPDIFAATYEEVNTDNSSNRSNQ